MFSLRPLGSTVVTRFVATMDLSDSRTGTPVDYLFSSAADWPRSQSAITGLSCSCLDYLFAPPSLTPECLLPAPAVSELVT